MSKQKISIAFILIIGAYVMFNASDTTPDISNNIPSDYIGMTTTQAEEKANRDGVVFRVVQEDGEFKPATTDLREGRINAVVVAGVVTQYTVETSEVSTQVPNTPETELPAEVVPTPPLSNSDAIIGMTAAEAEAYAKTLNVNFRIGMTDGEGQALTMDFQLGRITAEIEKGVVVGYSVEGE